MKNKNAGKDDQDISFYGVVLYEKDRVNQDAWTDFICCDDSVDGFLDISAVKLCVSYEKPSQYEFILLHGEIISVDGSQFIHAIRNCEEILSLDVDWDIVIRNSTNLKKSVSDVLKSHAKNEGYIL
jgi:hypothetical protein